MASVHPLPPRAAARPQLAKALLREGKREHRRASRLSSQTQATLRQASRQVLAAGARRRELEEAGQVRVPGPSPFPPGPGPAGSRAIQLFLPLPSSLLPPPASPKVGARLSEMERQIQESRASLEKDVKALSELLARLGEETPRLGP